MNEKSLNREDLEKLFETYKNVKNINEIKFLAKINKPSSNNLKFSNPHYNIIRPLDKKLPSFPTARTIVEIPSPYRLGANNQPYITKIPLFTTDGYTENYRNTINEDINYLAGIGHLQNYKVIQKRKATNGEHEMLVDFITNQLEKKLYVVSEVERVLGLLIDSGKQNMLLTNIWCNNVEDGNDLADKKNENNKLPQINEVTLQGIVYMPPSIREIKSKEEYSVHFKIRVKRELDDASQNVPTMHQAEYDFINVICFGKLALESFDKLKQGHPVFVTGRIESSKFLKAKRVNDFQKTKLAELLAIDVNSPYIRAIERYFIDNKVVDEYPNFNVWADKVVTNEDDLIK